MKIRSAVELFPCSGGMSLGFRRAGIEFGTAFDADPNAVDSHEKNLGTRPIQMDVRDLLRMLNGPWRFFDPFVDKLHLLVADPPCTPWSRAGKRRGLADERDMLAVTVELIQQLHPVCWLIGNVPGLDDSTNAGALQQTIGLLARDYDIDFARLDAAAYGVPQHRVRPFWFGRPKGSRSIKWPAPTHGGTKQAALPGMELLPYVTVRQALCHLSPKELGRKVRLKLQKTKHGHPPSRLDKPAGTIASSMPGNGGGVLFYGKDHKTSSWEAPAVTLTRNPMSDGALLPNTKHPLNTLDAPSYTITGGYRGVQGSEALMMDRPATTVLTRDEISRPKRNGRRESMSKNAIVLSEKAAAILQGFPEGWVFCGKTKRSRWDQIGMAMPSALAEAVAKSIVAWFEQHSVHAEKQLGRVLHGHRQGGVESSDLLP